MVLANKSVTKNLLVYLYKERKLMSPRQTYQGSFILFVYASKHSLSRIPGGGKLVHPIHTSKWTSSRKTCLCAKSRVAVIIEGNLVIKVYCVVWSKYLLSPVRVNFTKPVKWVPNNSISFAGNFIVYFYLFLAKRYWILKFVSLVSIFS